MIHTAFDLSEVATSILIAVVASYAALALSALVGARSGLARLPWLLGGGFAVGLGIATMHFVGMLAMHMSVPVRYDRGLTLLSFAVAILASSAALAAANVQSLRLGPMVLASTVFGGAVAGMHYIGMAAMHGSFDVAHNGVRVALSIVIAIAASAVAFWLGFKLRDASGIRGFTSQITSAMVMGVAIAGMHYVAMSAVSFTMRPLIPGVDDAGMMGRDVATLVTIVGLIILGGAILIALLDRRAKRAARELSEMNERYREMAEAMPQIVWTARADGTIDYCNRRWTEYTGRDLAAANALETSGVIHRDELDQTISRWRAALANETMYYVEYRLRGSDGDYRWHLGRAVPLRDSSGAVVRWFGTSTDIHEQKRAEGFLRAQQVTLEHQIVEREAEAERANALYQLLAENASDMVSTHRPNGTFDYATPSWVEFLGESPANRLPAELSHPDDTARLVENHKDGFVSSDPITTVWRCRRADGSYAWLETRTRAVKAPGTQRVVTFVCATRDVTQNKRDELALRESEDKYRQLVEQAADAILLIDADGLCAGANTRAGALTGLEPEALIGRPIAGFMAPVGEAALPRLQSPADASRWSGSVVTGEYSVSSLDGTVRPVEVSATQFADGTIQIIARDISSRKELERLKDQFLSVVSHELRTPLTSIRGSLGLLASGQLANAPDKAQRMVSLAVANTDRLIRLINDILDVERITSGAIAMSLSLFEGRDVANQVIEALRPMAERVGVSLAVTGPSVKLWADTDRITQTLTNLIGNAIKFSPAGSTIDVAIAVIGGEALFEVRDRGRGIPPEKLESIFERFQQVDTSDAREKGGTGLGLAISRGIVKQHGGRIWAENNPPSIGGSVFKFTVPLRSPPPAINSSAAEDAPPASSPEGLVARMARSLTIAALNPRVAR